MKRADNRFYREPERPVVITLTIEEAQRLSLGCADLLCWVQGFKAACPDNSERHPMGEYDVRNLRDHLTRGIEAAQTRQSK